MVGRGGAGAAGGLGGLIIVTWPFTLLGTGCGLELEPMSDVFFVRDKTAHEIDILARVPCNFGHVQTQLVQQPMESTNTNHPPHVQTACVTANVCLYVARKPEILARASCNFLKNSLTPHN